MFKSDNQNNTLRYAGLATQWMAMLGIAAWAGYKLDHYVHWKIPVFTILLPVAALGLSLWQLIAELNKPKK